MNQGHKRRWSSHLNWKQFVTGLSSLWKLKLAVGFILFFVYLILAVKQWSDGFRVNNFCFSLCHYNEWNSFKPQHPFIVISFSWANGQWQIFPSLFLTAVYLENLGAKECVALLWHLWAVMPLADLFENEGEVGFQTVNYKNIIKVNVLPSFHVLVVKM